MKTRTPAITRNSLITMCILIGLLVTIFAIHFDRCIMRLEQTSSDIALGGEEECQRFLMRRNEHFMGLVKLEYGDALLFSYRRYVEVQIEGVYFVYLHVFVYATESSISSADIYRRYAVDDANDMKYT